MINYFPTPYPGEVFYSWIARYQHRTLKSSKSIFRDLFGCRHNPVSILLPRRLKKFSETIAPIISISEELILKKMTLWQYLQSTIPEDRRENILRSLNIFLNEDSKKKEMNSVIRGRITHEAKYCVLCNQEDMENFGELYLHRDHQIPGILLCQKHNCFLEVFSLKNGQFSDYIFVMQTLQVCNVKIPRLNENELLLKITDKMILLANGADISNCFDPDYLSEFGKASNYILRKNWNMIRLNQDISSFYRSVSEYPQLRFNKGKPPIPEGLWLGLEKRSSPLTYVLMLLFIESKRSSTIEPEQWKCINQVCSNYKLVVPHKEELFTQPKRSPMKVVICECGMRTQVTYDKNGKFLKRTVLERGHLWNKKLAEGIEAGLSQEKLAKQLGVDATTISYQANKLGIEHPWKIERGKPRPNKIKSSHDKQADRAAWLKLLNSQNFKTVSQSRIGNWGLYGRLKRTDIKWLKETNKSRYVRAKSKSTKIDEIDNSVYQKLLKSFDSLKKSNVRFRISIGVLLRSVGLNHSYIYSNSNLGKSGVLLAEIAESVEEYQIRRIAMVNEEMQNAGESVTLNKLLKRASLTRSKISEKVFMYLESTVGESHVRGN